MTTSLHIIFKQQFHLRFIGGEIAVHTLSAALSRWQRDVLLPGMQQILDELDVADQHLRLDALQIDAGEITGGDWEQQLANKICRELRKEIISRAVWSKSTNEIKTGPGNDKNGLDKKYAGNPSGKKPVDDSVAGFKHNSYKASYPDIAAQQKHNNYNDLTIEGEGTALPGFSEASPQLPVTGAPDIMATDMHNSTGSSQLSAFTQEEKKNEDDLRDKISRFNEAEQLELVLYYLQTGALPWYAAALPGKDTLHWLNELITAGYLYSKAGIAFISAHPVALQRLLMQVTPVLLQQSFRQWNTPVFQQYFPEIDRIATSLFDVGNARVWAYAVLYDLLADPAMSAPVPLWKQWLTSENVAYDAVMNIFTQHKGMQKDRIFPKEVLLTGGYSVGEEDKQTSSSSQVNIANADKQITSDQVLPSSPDKQVVGDQISSSSPAQPADTATVDKEVVGASSPAQPVDEQMEDVQEHITSVSRKIIEKSDLTRKESAPLQTEIKNSVSSPLILKDEPHTAENGLFINNAGLVLLHPFISPWLTNLGLLEEDNWKDISAHRRAVQLLYYLSSGSLTSADYELPLCKLLLGFPLDEPAAAELDVTEEEETESRDLLQEVIRQWPILKDTSPESLQETFLLRDGRLIHHPGKWQLNVAQSPYDMLLQHMPWGFGVIRSSMMKELLFVEWA